MDIFLQDSPVTQFVEEYTGIFMVLSLFFTLPALSGSVFVFVLNRQKGIKIPTLVFE